MYPSFNPYGVMPMPYQPPRPALPQQQVITVAGPDSLAQIQMGPNSTQLVMEQAAPVVYLVQTDGVGKVSWTAYDITPHKDAAQVQQESIDKRIAALEAAVKRLEDKHEPDAS
jgi:hypothetical protein